MLKKDEFAIECKKKMQYKTKYKNTYIMDMIYDDFSMHDVSPYDVGDHF